LSQAGESVVVERVADERIAGEPGFEVADHPEELPQEVHDGLERTVGIALAVLGLVLMALAAI
jgi:hypothetical protein